MRGMARRDLTDEQWGRLEPLLPPRKPKTGKPNLDHRRIINGILWLLRTRAPRDGLRGRPRRRPARVAGDKACSNRRIRRSLRRRGIRVTIPRQRNERRRGPFSAALYRLRARVEHLINRLKQFRRIATRYEKRAESYL